MAAAINRPSVILLWFQPPKSSPVVHLILYSKPGCHLCAGLQEKLEPLLAKGFSLEVRDITQRHEWSLAYAYEVPVLHMVIGGELHEVPRFPPRMSAHQIEQRLRQLILEGGH